MEEIEMDLKEKIEEKLEEWEERWEETAEHFSEEYQKHKKVIIAMAVLMVGVVGLVLLNPAPLSNTFKTSPIKALVQKADGKMRRSIRKNKFSLHYEAEEPNTVVIRIRYYPDVDMRLMYSVVQEAERNIKIMGSKEFGIPYVRTKRIIKLVNREENKYGITF